MKSNERSHNRFEYINEGVTASIPPQAKHDKVKPKLNALVWEPGMREQTNFIPLRLVINLEFHDEDTDELLEEFDPPIEFQVNYTLKDKDNVKGSKGNERSLKIAYWKDNQWKLITEDTHKLTDNRSPSGQDSAGIFRFEIRSWGEPSIAIGL